MKTSNIFKKRSSKMWRFYLKNDLNDNAVIKIVADSPSVSLLID